MEKKQAAKLTALCCLVYFASYITRLDYAAVLVEIVQDLQIAKTTASIAVTGSFITYGAGMLIFGVLGDRITPRAMITIGLIGTSTINLCMGLLPNIYVMIGIWCFNGFFQAMLWPPVTRTLTENLGESAAREAIAKVIQAAQIATLGIYILSPLAIRLASWRTVFLGASVIGFVAVALWYPSTANIRQHRPAPAQNQPQTPAVERAPVGRLVMAAGLIPMMIAIVLMGLLRDGLQTWMPTYVCEVFGLSTETSILLTSLLPVLSMLAIAVSTRLFRTNGDETITASILFGLSTVCAAVMALIFPGPATLGVFLFALLAGSMHGVNQMIICFTPTRFEAYGRVSTFSGLLNCFVYVGAAISTYGFAGFSEAFGWRSTMVMWTGLAVLGTVFCLICIPKWRAFYQGKAKV